MTESREAALYTPYASYGEMQDAYLRLSEEYEQAGDSIPEGLRPQFEQFIGRAVATGVILESASERRSAQGLIDYWRGQLGEGRRSGQMDAGSSASAGSSGSSGDPLGPVAMSVPPPQLPLSQVLESLRSQPLRRYDPEQAPELPEYACPYPGLAPYTATESDRYFGREELAREIIANLKKFRIVLVQGGAGSGKTSLVQARVLPLLQADALPGSKDWRYVTLTPGRKPEWPRDLIALEPPPVAKLAKAVVEGTPPPVTLLFIDQLEELFQLASPASRSSYMDSIMRSLVRPDVRIILSLRTEFFGQLTAGGVLPAPSMSGQQLPSVLSLNPLTAPELRAVIEKPAAKVGLLFESGVVDRLVGEFLGDPTGLPLLQLTLSTLWNKRYRNRIPRAVYEELGGGRELLAKQATQVYEALPKSIEQPIARRILLRLLRPHEGSAVEAMRVMVRVSDIFGTEPAETKEITQAVLGKLLGEHLLHRIGLAEAPSEEHLVELAHDCLARHWTLLNGWVASAQIPLRQRRRWEALYTEWVRANNRDIGLLDGRQIDELSAWVGSDEAKDIGFHRGLYAYLKRSREVIAASEHKLQRAQRFAMTAALALGVVILVGVLALYYRVRARELDLAEERGRQLLNDPSMRHEAALWLDYALHRRSGSNTLRPLLADALRPLYANRGVLVDPVQRESGWAVPDVSDSAFSPDGTLVATAAHDGMVRLWDVASGRLIRRMAGHTREVTSVNFSPDGRYIVSAGVDGSARVRLTDSGNAPVLISHPAPLHSAEYSPDGAHIVTAAVDKVAAIWDAKNGQRIARLLGHHDEVMAATYSPNGRLIATAGKDKQVILWDARSHVMLTQLGPHAGAVWHVAFSPDGETLVAASMDGVAQVWEVPAGHKAATLRGDTGALYSASFSPDGKRIVTGSDDNTVRIWDARSGQELGVLTGHTRAVGSVSYRSDGQLLLSASGDGTTRLWRPELGQPRFVLSQDGTPLSAAHYSPDGKWIVAAELEQDEPGPDSASIHLWDATSGRPLDGLVGHSQTVLAAAWSPDGTRLLTGAADQSARIFTLAAGSATASAPPQILAHPDQVTAVAFSPDGARALTACSDRKARVFAVADGKLLYTLSHQTPISSVHFSPDGRRIVSTTQDDVAYVWDATTGTALAQLIGHSSSVVSAAYSPDGRRIATASVDRSARIWDAKSGALLQQLRGHTGPVLSVAFSPDSQTLVTGSGDRTARLWEAAKGRASLTLRGHTQAVHSAQFSADGTQVVTASQDGTLRVWDVQPEEHEPALISRLLSCRVALHLDHDLNILPNPLTGMEPGCENLPAVEDAPPHWQDRDRELLTILYALRAGQGGLAQRFVPSARAALERFPDPLLRAQLVWAEAALGGDAALPAPPQVVALIASLPSKAQRSAWETMSAIGIEYLYRPRWSLFALEQARKPELLVGMTGLERRRLAANRIEVLLAAGEPAQALSEGLAAWHEQAEIGDRVVLSALLWLAAVQVKDVAAQGRWSDSMLRYYGFLTDGTLMSWSFVGSRHLLEQAAESEARSKGLKLFSLLAMSRHDATLQELANLFARDVPSDALRLKK